MTAPDDLVPPDGDVQTVPDDDFDLEDIDVGFGNDPLALAHEDFVAVEYADEARLGMSAEMPTEKEMSDVCSGNLHEVYCNQIGVKNESHTQHATGIGNHILWIIHAAFHPNREICCQRRWRHQCPRHLDRRRGSRCFSRRSTKPS